MRDRFPHLAQRLFNVPLALHPDKAEIVMAALADRLGVARLFRDMAGQAEAAAMLAPELSAMPEPERAYDVHEGVAIVPVHGTLVQKSGSLRPYCGMTGYDGIRAGLGQALSDPAVRAIALDVDSPGGEVAGCFDLVDAIHAARGSKPIWAILTENAYSAGYAIASAADRVLVPRTGGAGSIGVIAMLTEWSRAMDAAGITVTILQFGARKADGNEYQPLPPEARARFQAQLDAMGALFVATVARNRGLSPAAVRAQEAATYLGTDAVAAGLADAVMAPDEAFAELVALAGAAPTP